MTSNCHFLPSFVLLWSKNSIFWVNVPKLSHFVAVFYEKKCDNLRSWTVIKCLPPDSYVFWEIFENCQLKTLLNSKIIQIITVV